MSRARAVAAFVPPGGDPNTTLTKASAADYDFGWGAGSGLPPSTAGESGQALVVGDDGFPVWGEAIDHPTQEVNGGGF